MCLQVWDIVHSCVVYQSTIISASPFLSLILNPLQENLVLGTADGQVREAADDREPVSYGQITKQIL